jgi:hypothetical protein
MMNASLRITIATGFTLALLGGGSIARATPAAPALLAPANGAQITVPFTISWSTGSDPSGIVAYNWQVSPAAAFSPVIQQSSERLCKVTCWHGVSL